MAPKPRYRDTGVLIYAASVVFAKVAAALNDGASLAFRLPSGSFRLPSLSGSAVLQAPQSAQRHPNTTQSAELETARTPQRSVDIRRPGVGAIHGLIKHALDTASAHMLAALLI